MNFQIQPRSDTPSTVATFVSIYFQRTTLDSLGTGRMIYSRVMMLKILLVGGSLGQFVESFAPTRTPVVGNPQSSTIDDSSSNCISAFSNHPFQSSSASTKLYGIRCEDKFYQLEEKEDGESSRTEVYLMQDRQVDFGKTDGPVPDYVEGQWHVEPGSDEFTMTIRRVFGTGKKGSDMGEFSFEILREMRGDLTMVGESVAITGTIVNKDELLGDKEVGYFNMVDDTEERESYALEGRFKYEIDKTKGLKLSEYTFFASETVGKLRGMFAQVNWNELGPGGYDPNEVFGALPTEMANAFQQQDFLMLESCLQAMPEEEAIYYLDGCINAGLWWTEDQINELKQQEWQPQQAAGPGGLDPMEVWQSLPPMMQQAFEMQDTTMLETALSFMSTEEADYHMKRCEDSGLWG